MSQIAGSFVAWTEAENSLHGPHGRIAWWQEGEGRPLLLIHGFPTASWDWSRIWPGLVASGRRVIALDMLGFGWSDKPRHHRYDMMEQADLHAQLLHDLDIHEVDIVAHDYGVSIAQELVARQAENKLDCRIGAVAWLNGGLIPGEHRPRLIQRLLEGPLGPILSSLLTRSQFGRSFSAVFGPDTQPDEDELEAFWMLLSNKDGHRLGHKLIQYMGDRRRHKARWVGVLGKGLVRERMINGLLDPVSGAHLADAYAALAPDADIIRLDDVGHYPQWEAPDRVLKAILEFL